MDTFAIVKLRGNILAYRYVKHIVDGKVVCTFPGSDDMIVFFPEQIITVTTEKTRSFTCGLAIAEFIEDEEFELACQQKTLALVA